MRASAAPASSCGSVAPCCRRMGDSENGTAGPVRPHAGCGSQADLSLIYTRKRSSQPEELSSAKGQQPTSRLIDHLVGAGDVARQLGAKEDVNMALHSLLS
jgi:hypothetical protein